MEWDFYWLARVLEKNERRFFKKNFSFLLYTLENVGRLLLYACNNWFMKMPSNSRGPNIRSIVMFYSYSCLVVLHQRRLQICNRFSKAVAHFLSSSRANIETAAKPKGVVSSLMHMIIIWVMFCGEIIRFHHLSFGLKRRPILNFCDFCFETLCFKFCCLEEWFFFLDVDAVRKKKGKKQR